MTWLACALTLAVQLPEGDPARISALRTGESVRILRKGGLTQRGMFYSLAAFTTSGKLFIKDVDGEYSYRLSAAEQSDLANSIRTTNLSNLQAKPRSEPYGPSAYDGTDVYMSFRQGLKKIRWNNIHWHDPESFPLREILEKIIRTAKEESLLQGRALGHVALQKNPITRF